MSNHIRFPIVLPILMIAISACSCASMMSRADAGDSDAKQSASGCEATGDECRAQGVLRILIGGRGAGELVVDENTCLDLALDRKIYEEWRSWNGKSVELVGRTYPKPNLRNISWIDVLDRKIEGGGCGKVAIYVDDIRRIDS